MEEKEYLDLMKKYSDLQDEYLALMKKHSKLLSEHKEILVENSHLREQLSGSHTEELTRIVHEKEAAILAAMSALTIYADKEMYCNYDEDFKFSTIELDEGKMAREALEAIKNKA